MFLVAVKTAIVESLRSVWFVGQNAGQEAHDYNPALTGNASPLPRRISLEYSEEAEDWPLVLIQFRPSVVEWTGISPDEQIDATLDKGIAPVDQTTTDDPTRSANPSYKVIRQGRFEGSCMLQVMATTSMERDRIWDNIVKLLLMGRMKSPTINFYTTLESHDLVGITVMEGSIRPVGDTVVPGTPWDPELLSYEAAVEFDIVGTFYADEYTQDLVPLAAAQVYEYIAWDGNTGTGPDANQTPTEPAGYTGDWQDPWE